MSPQHAIAIEGHLEAEHPRTYQLELLERAKQENVIAYLETGAGKTLVSALLMRDLLECAGEKKFVIFLVERVPLVIQQMKYVQRVLGNTISAAMFYGEMNVDAWGAERWREATEGKNALFMTAQILLNVLRHDVIHFDDILLLIFDEAHHATKLHPYNLIMREFYFPARRAGLSLPRIFGMSASPVKKKSATTGEEYCMVAIKELQQNLHARVVAVSAPVRGDVEACAPKPDEWVITYDEEEGTFSDGEKETLGLACNMSHKNLSGNDAVQQSIAAVRSAIGPYVAKFFENTLTSNEEPLPSPSLLPATVISSKVRALLDLLLHESRRWDELPGVDSKFRAIVFVQRRDVAACLSWVINELFCSCNSSVLSSKLVSGARTGSSHEPLFMRTTQAEQSKRLKEFREGVFGILVATSVVEEGLDVASCGLVVMFDSVPSPKVYVQSRGRARHAASRYVVIAPRGRKRGFLVRTDLLIAREGADILGQVINFISDEPEDVSVATNAISEPVGLELEGPVLLSGSTRARVSPTAAVDLLNVYLNNLPKDIYFDGDALSPVYKVSARGPGFTCIVLLPTSCPVKTGHCRSVQPSKVKAKRLAAFDVYTQLYKCGALDEHLYPKDYLFRFPVPLLETDASDERLVGFNTLRDENRKSRMAKKAAKRERICSVQPPMPFRWPRNSEKEDQSAEEAWLYEIAVDGSLLENESTKYMRNIPSSSRFGFVVKQKLDGADLEVINPPSGSPLFTLKLVGPISLSKQQDESATRYGLALYQIAVDKTAALSRRPTPASGLMKEPCTNAENPSNCSTTDGKLEMAGFHLVPLLTDCSRVITRDQELDAIVDWRSMDALTSFRGDVFDALETSGSAPNTLDYSVVQSRHDTKYVTYFTGATSSELCASSQCGNCVGRGVYATYDEYYSSRHNAQVRDLNQSLIPGYKKCFIGDALQGEFYLIPELCRVVPVSPWALYFLGLIPHWQTFQAIQNLRRELKIEESISFEQFATALQPRRSSPHCIGVNYERLEFLGDAVLKGLVSMAVFHRNPCAHEGLLTRMRDDVVCNSFLCDRALSRKLYNVLSMTGASVKPKAWPWLMGCPPEMRLAMSEKVLADSMEAMIGLYYECGGIPLAARLIDELGLGADVCAAIDSPRREVRRRQRSTGPDPRATSPRVEAVEKIIGYTFADKELLVEALTHGSFRGSEVCSYQRLEFLGDAIIGFLILKGFYYKYDDLDPAQLTLLREPGLSNDLFGRVSLENGLHKYLWHDSPVLETDMKAIEEKFAAVSDSDTACEELVLPKVLGDILESLLGAVFVDDGMKMDAAERFVDRLVGNALERHANPETLAAHPVTKMAQALQQQYQESPEFIFEDTQDIAGGAVSAAQGIRGADAMVCTVRVAGVALAKAVGANRRKAKRSAAQAVLENLDLCQDGKPAPIKRRCIEL